MKRLPTNMGRRLLLGLFGLLISVGWCKQAAAGTCTQSGIQAIAPPDATITSATEQSSPAQYCDVLGYVTTGNPGPNKDLFELVLPDTLTGGFIFAGNGGFAGSLEGQIPLSLIASVGAAGAITDTGHESSAPDPGLDASFALNNPAAADDWLYRSVHVITVTSKAIINGYYNRPLPGSLFFGCSNGGRQAMVEAEQFPTDFNAIIAISPALGNWPAGFNWNSERVTALPDNFIPPDKIVLVDKAVLQSCDDADGVVDGLIQDPRACNFDPSSLQCKGADAPTCLTAGQIATFKAVYRGAKKVYPGYTQSDPGSDNGWSPWVIGLAAPDALGTAEPWTSVDNAPAQFLFQDQFFKYLVFNNPNYDSLSFNINDANQLAQLQAVVTRGGADGTNPDLSAFKQNGGKLIIYQGWSDAAVTPLETVQLYKDIARKMGGITKAQQFARLFMFPGMQHCGGGPGPDAWDPFGPIVNWLLNGIAPTQITAFHFQNDDPSTGVITRSMPVCMYPNQAQYIGGDVNQASSWTCPSDN